MQLLEQMIQNSVLLEKATDKSFNAKFHKEFCKISNKLLKLVKDANLPTTSGLNEYDVIKLAIEELDKKNTDGYTFPSVEIKSPDEMRKYLKSIGYKEDILDKEKDILSTMHGKSMDDYFVYVGAITGKESDTTWSLDMRMYYVPRKGRTDPFE